ncbi:MAG: hypothetical protein U0587_16455 [Candidatus Binatia bacterium]
MARAHGLEDLLGVAAERINEDRLYRLLDHLVWHKSDIEHHLRNRLGELLRSTTTCCCMT